MNRILRVTAAIAALMFLPAIANAGPLLINYSNGSLSASASFDVDGTNLIATLTNTSTADPARSTDILTGVFFNVLNDPDLAPLSAVICADCKITNDGATGPDGSVGGEWGYRHKTNLAYGDNYGLSATSLGSLFGATSVTFPEDTNVYSTVSPGGVDYGITSAAENDCSLDKCNDSGSILWIPMIQNQVIFTLTGLPKGFSLTDISNVKFQYGTSLTTPEPAPLGLLATGLLVSLAACRRKRERG